jgi:hypothetical protein
VGSLCGDPVADVITLPGTARTSGLSLIVLLALNLKPSTAFARGRSATGPTQDLDRCEWFLARLRRR